MTSSLRQPRMEVTDGETQVMWKVSSASATMSEAFSAK